LQKSGKLPIPATAEIYTKYSNKYNFISAKDGKQIYKIHNFAYMVRFTGSAKSNMLCEISRKPKKLPWQ